jgi:hypothetical protein
MDEEQAPEMLDFESASQVLEKTLVPLLSPSIVIDQLRKQYYSIQRWYDMYDLLSES